MNILIYQGVHCQARSQTFCERGQIGQILGPFMITRGLSCNRVGFGHFGESQITPPGYRPDCCTKVCNLHVITDC